MRILIILAILLLFVGCTKTAVVEEQPAPVEEKVNVVEEPVQVVEKTPEEICHDNAVALMPESIDLSLANSKDPESDNWEWNDSFAWADGTPMDVKGTVSFREGRLEGENPNLWYTVNTQNEDLVHWWKIFHTAGESWTIPSTNWEGAEEKS